MVNIDTLSGINQVLGITDSYQAPDKIMEILLSQDEREKAFQQLLELFQHDLSYDWFHIYFQSEHADRKEKKQDFTPMSVAKIICQLTNVREGIVHEIAAGTGGITIVKWHESIIKHISLDYLPSNYLYVLEELSDRTVPFLLLNLMIRGMNAAVLHGDSLERSFKQIYFVQNSENNPAGFSELNVMPRSRKTEEYFDVRKWLGEPLVHVESSRPLSAEQ